MAKDEFFLVGQKAFITNKNGELLVLIDPERGLDLPGGKIQEGEYDFDQALKREVREETALEIEIGQPFIRWFHRGTVGSLFAGKPFFLLGFYCKLVSGEIKLSDEHTQYFWVDKSTYHQYKGEPGYELALKTFFKDA